MKKLLSMFLAANFVLWSVISAAAVEITAQGSFDFSWGWSTNQNFFDNTQNARFQSPSQDQFFAVQRERLQVNFVASENVRGLLYFEIGTDDWGQPGEAQIGTDNRRVEVRRAYIEFNVPNTELIFRVGMQNMTLPAAVTGNPILGDSGTDMAGIVAVYPINDMVSIAALWARPWNMNGRNDPWNGAWAGTGNQGTSANDEIDVVGMYVPIAIDGMMTITPWAAYAIAGTDAVYDLFNPNSYTVWSGPNGGSGLISQAALYGALGNNPWNANIARNYINNDYQYFWWAGGAFEFTMLDPLTFGLDVAFGSSIDPSEAFLNRQGWYFAGRMDYATPYMTPGLIAWYTTGDDENIWNGSERIPQIDGSFLATRYGFGDNDLIGPASGLFNSSAEGTWGVALLLSDISFVEDLTQQFRIAYYAGTNSVSSIYDYRAPATVNGFAALTGAGSDIMLTTADYAWEINFDHKYQIYENLAAVVEMGMLDIEREAKPWRQQANRINSGVYNATAGQLWKTSTMWKLAFGLKYRF